MPIKKAVVVLSISCFIFSPSISLGEERQVADRCEVCGDALARAVNICLTSSARPEDCVNQAMSSYFNCVRKETKACEGTKGRKLYDCINECEGLKCVEECLK